MGHMGYRFASGLGKGRLPVLIARDGVLSADSLRAAIALFNHLAACSDPVVTVADIMGATGLPPQRAQAALAALAAAGYIEGYAAVAESPRTTGPPGLSAAASRPAPSAPRPGKGGKLKAGIMDYEWDLDGLIRAGNANIRDAGRRAPPHRPDADAAAGNAPDGAGAANWGPLLGEDSQPAAMRFMVWLRFVLSPDEMAACDRFALAHKDQWNGWITRFSPAKAAGAEGELLDDIRRSLGEAADHQAAPPPPDPGSRLSRPN